MSSKNTETPAARRELFRRLADAAQPTAAMPALPDETFGERLRDFGITRRGFMQFCAGMAALMGLPPTMVKAMAADLLDAEQLTPVVYMSFQECTGCLESLVNLTAPARIGEVILGALSGDVHGFSLEYQETIMQAAGKQAEDKRNAIIFPADDPRNPRPELSKAHEFVLVVDGSIPAKGSSGYFVSAGQSGLTRFREAAQFAKAIVAVGSCASWGGIPHAFPNPTGAVGIGQLIEQINQDGPLITAPLINLPGCPPIAEVIAGALIAFILNDKFPATYPAIALDDLQRPTMFYGPPGSRGPKTVHSDCERLPHFIARQYAASFADEATRQLCLYNLGCKGPRTRNACTTVKWNQGMGYPMKSGHGCIGCSQPNFWDGVYTSQPTWAEVKMGWDEVGHDANFAFKGFYDPLPPR